MIETEYMYTTAQVSERTGVTRKQIRAWTRRGLIAPAWHTERQRHHLWREDDIRRIEAARDAYRERLAKLARDVGQ